MGNEKLKEALFIDNFYPIIDGVVKVVDNYATEFTKLGDEVQVYTPGARDPLYVDDKPYKVVRTPFFVFFKLIYPLARPNKKEIRNQLKEFHPDIIHAHSPFFMGSFGIKMAHKMKIPIVATFHSKFYDDLLEETHSKIIAKIGTRKIVRFFKKCDSVWTVSNSSAETLRQYGYKGNIEIMPNGTHLVTPENYVELGKKMRQKYKIKENEKVILFVGQLIWQKNLKLIIKVFKELVNQDKSYRLLIVGEGGHESAVKEYAAKKKLPKERINFLGKISDKELLQGIYSCADLFFFPSTYDTFGIVVCEAAVHHTPSLLVRGSNAAENIIDGVNGFLAENDLQSMTDKVKEIFANKDKMKEVGAEAAKTLPKTWDELAIDVRKQYEKIIENYKMRSRK